MADNVTLNVGSGGSDLATDQAPDTTGPHYQKIKIADGTANGTGMVAADAANGLDVDVTRLPAAPANGGVDIGDVTVNNAAGAPVPVQQSDGTAVQTFATADLDSGAGTVTRIINGIAVAAAGGPVAVSGDATNGLDVDVTRLPALVAGTANIGDVDVLTVPSTTTLTDTITAAEDAATLVLGKQEATAGIYISGTWTATLEFEATIDGTNWFALFVHPVGGAIHVASTAANGQWRAGVAGFARIRVRASAYTSGTATVVFDAGWGTHAVHLAASSNAIGKLAPNSGVDIGDVDVLSLPALPTGTNNIGDVDVLSIAAGDNNIGNVDIVTMPSVTIGTFPDNEPFNVAQINGVAPLMGNGVTGTGSQRVTVASDNTAFTVNIGTFPDNEPINVAQMNGVAVTMGNGVSGTGVQRVTIASDSTGQVAVASIAAGTNAIGKLAANSGVDIGDVDVTSISAGTNAIGNVGLIPRTSGGMSIFRSLDIDETEEEIKATAGQVFSITAFNTTAVPVYLKFYNATAATVVVGTTTPVLTFLVPANADSDGAGFVWNNEIGWVFGTAITVAATTGKADNDTGAPAVDTCLINIGYA